MRGEVSRQWCWWGQQGEVLGGKCGPWCQPHGSAARPCQLGYRLEGREGARSAVVKGRSRWLTQSSSTIVPLTHLDQGLLHQCHLLGLITKAQAPPNTRAQGIYTFPHFSSTPPRLTHLDERLLHQCHLLGLNTKAQVPRNTCPHPFSKPVHTCPSLCLFPSFRT